LKRISNYSADKNNPSRPHPPGINPFIKGEEKSPPSLPKRGLGEFYNSLICSYYFLILTAVEAGGVEKSKV